jgi:hypothetical protein
MTGSLKKIILLGFCAGAILMARAQVKFTASISPGEISKNEYAVLRLEVQNAESVEQITPPTLKDFIIVSGPNQESGMSNVNGVVKQYLALSYILQPRRIGSLELGTCTAKISGKQYKSNRLRLTVKKGNGPGTQPGNVVAMNGQSMLNRFDEPEPVEDMDDYILKKDESVQAKVANNMQLKLQTSKSSCFVGEPIVATYKLYTRLKSESKLSKTPAFNGFSVIEIQRPEETEYAREKLNGREYHVYTIRKAQLYPLQDGPVELESDTLENVVRFLKPTAAAGSQENMYRFLNGFAVSPDDIATETVSLSSKPVSITVKPLPEKGKPAGFKGAVGNFTIDANLEKNSFASNETGKLTVTISGDGNLQLVTAPEITWPAGIETFEGKESEDLIHTSVPVSGVKTFEFPFAIDQPGEYELPAFAFSYFDPATVSYKTLQVPAKKFTVTKGLPRPTYPTDPIVAKQSLGFSRLLFNNRGLIVGGIALLMISGILAWMRNERKINAAAKRKASVLTPVATLLPEEPINTFRQTASFNLRNPLSKSEDCLKNTDCTQFYSLLYGEMKEWLAARFSLRKEDLTVKSIAAAMDKAGVDNDVVLQLQQLLQEIEWQLYTPFESGEEMALIHSRSQTILQSINRSETAIL